MSKIAVVQIRGSIGAVAAANNALDTLNLDSKHQCVILDDTATNKGLLQ
ncbi:MAG: uL30 family ribosomal protein, partial [Halobacteriaceae archaeon]